MSSWLNEQLDDFQVFRKMNSEETVEGYQKLPYYVVFDRKFDFRKSPISNYQ